MPRIPFMPFRLSPGTLQVFDSISKTELFFNF